MKQAKVMSREYKIMLQASRFAGSADELCRHAQRFWHTSRQTIRQVVFDTDGDLDAVDTQRLIRFYDTPGQRLRQHDYLFRERQDERSGDREVMLKFRHPDRYVAQDRDLDTPGGARSESKFEADIKRPFQPLYSLSTKQRLAPTRHLDTMNDLGRLYPGLPPTLDVYNAAEAITVVGDFTARELVLTGADFQIGNGPKIEAECALIVWYDATGSAQQPVVVEYSFRYGDKNEHYDGEVARRAYDAFQLLQSEALADWVDNASFTKTAYVYSRA
jgi:hypothetical protein